MSVQSANNAPQAQIQLPFSKAWQISIQSIKTRLMRAIITASGIMLGIFFYSYIRSIALFPSKAQGTAAEMEAVQHQWLAVMALLVCFVGIMNSMLMSVTERFREIGTMKCLGALDRFIVTLFFIEAGLMGSVASAIGWFVGWLSNVVIQMFSGGLKHIGGSFWVGTLEQALTCVGIGLGLTLVAAIPPAMRAAKMPPAMALRSEI